MITIEILSNLKIMIVLEWWDTAGGVNQLQKKTNRLFRDVSAWYHIVVL
jgi:hypothetical protein